MSINFNNLTKGNVTSVVTVEEGDRQIKDNFYYYGAK